MEKLFEEILRETRSFSELDPDVQERALRRGGVPKKPRGSSHYCDYCGRTFTEDSNDGYNTFGENPSDTDICGRCFDKEMSQLDWEDSGNAAYQKRPGRPRTF